MFTSDVISHQVWSNLNLKANVPAREDCLFDPPVNLKNFVFILNIVDACGPISFSFAFSNLSVNFNASSALLLSDCIKEGMFANSQSLCDDDNLKNLSILRKLRRPLLRSLYNPRAHAHLQHQKGPV